MNRKITFPELTALLSARTGETKKQCEQFLKELFGTVINSLVEGESVKIKGLGTFRLTEIESRKSVNVNTGMEFEIPGHRRVTFVAAKSLAERINEPFESFETIELSDDVTDSELDAVDEAASAEEQNDTAGAVVVAEDDVEDTAADNQEAGATDIAESDSITDSEEDTSAEAVEEVVDSVSEEASPGFSLNQGFEFADEQQDDDFPEELSYNLEDAEDELPSADCRMPSDESDVSSADDTDSGSQEDSSAAADSVSAAGEPAKEDASHTEPADYTFAAKEDEMDVEAIVESVESEVEGDADVDVPDSKDEAPKPDSEPAVQSAADESVTPQAQPEAAKVSVVTEPPYEKKKRSFIFGSGFVAGIITCFFIIAVVAALIYNSDGFSTAIIATGTESDETVKAITAADVGAADTIAPLPAMDSVAAPAEILEPQKEVEQPKAEEKSAEAEKKEIADTKPSDSPVYDTITKQRFLTTMAKQHYGNYHLWPYIYEANKSLGHPDRIRPGTKVIVPPLSKLGIDPDNPADITKAKRKGAAIYARYANN